MDQMLDEMMDNIVVGEKKKEKFSSSKVEKVIAVLVIALSYFYSYMCMSAGEKWEMCFGIFTIAFLVLGEVLYWNKKRTFESWFFMAMTIITGTCVTFNIGSVWEDGSVLLFTHLFAVYWVLVRSHSLAEDKTSHMFAYDGVIGFFIMPFSNYVLIVSTIMSIFGEKKEKREKQKIDQDKLWSGIMAGAIALVLLVVAVAFLKHSDANYNRVLGDIASLFTIDFDIDLVFKIILTVVISMYTYGLLGGCYRATRKDIEEKAEPVYSMLEVIAKVGPTLWAIFIGVFSVFYIIYFLIQGSYLFDAFRMLLPQEFTYSEYARKGFGDMCAVMVINLGVLWLANRMTEKKTKPLKIASTALVIESILFDIIAFLKLFMYINAYGYTPLRLQSVWLVAVLFIACICILISMYLHKKTARAWFMISSAMLVILCLI